MCHRPRLLQAGERDVFVSTYAKAGTTWTQMIVKLLLSGGEEDGRPYGHVIPWLEALASDLLADREAPGHSLESIAAKLGQPRYFKTHASATDLPGSLDSGAKVIYVARNPKDTAISLFHHSIGKPEFGFKGDMDTFLRIFLAGRAECGCWFDHVLGWHRESVARPDTVLFLHYEDMVDDPSDAVRTIARFIGLGSLADDDKVVEQVVSGSSMTAMKGNKAANIGMGHLRKGGYGGWRDVFTEEQSAYFNAVYDERMKGTGLDIRFE